MSSKKDIKHYALIFVYSVIALLIYIIYLYIKDGELSSETVLSLFIVPFMFVILLFIFDKVLELIMPNKLKKKESLFTTYLNRVSKAIQEECSFTIEEYSRLRKSQKFQKSLEQSFRIYEKGEAETINFEFLEKKFKKNTNEYIALQIVIKEVKQMMENS